MGEKKRLSVLFVCVENSCRSQMAEGFAKHLFPDKYTVFSAGSKPAKEVNPSAIIVMQELGIDISKNIPKGFSDLPINEFDCIVTMGCLDVCPYFPAKQKVDWQIPDPKGKDLNYFRTVRDIIKEKIVLCLTINDP
ncbi:MAG: arsenate reductase ArsC [Candidatus Margulisiibacteriota bacterium]